MSIKNLSGKKRYQFIRDYDQSFLEEIKDSQTELNPDSTVQIFRAKQIITMNPMQPFADSVATLDGKIFAVSSYEDIIRSLDLKNLKYKTVDDFKDSFLFPGFIETHCHVSAMAIYMQWEFVGPFKQKDADGNIIGGLTSKNEVVNRLRDCIKTNVDKALFGWGYDPVLVKDEDPVLNRNDLDKVSTEKPVCVINMSSHLAYVNSRALEIAGFNKSTDIEGVMKDIDGNPTGELREIHAMGPVFAKLMVMDDDFIFRGILNAGKLARKSGTTTISDLGTGLIPNAWKSICKATSMSDFPARISAYVVDDLLQKHGIDSFFKAKSYENDNLRLAGVKLFTDGSIQGYTAFMKWPCYYNSNDNGILNMKFDDLYRHLKEYQASDIQCSIHTNGSQAIENTVRAIEHIMRFAYDRDPRFRLEHVQTVNETTLSKMAKYDILPSFFVNHLHYWGDFHSQHSLGEAGTAMMNPLASAIRHNIKFALHSDCPVNPVDPLMSIWCAVTRKSMTGKVNGPAECISVYDALKSVTIDAAYLMREEEIKGSIEVGKLADMAVLDRNILKINPDDIPKTKVEAVIKGGIIYKN